MGRGIGSMEAFCITKYGAGDVFYTHKEDKHLTAIASYYGAKIKTERLVAIDKEKHERIEFITKVTML